MPHKATRGLDELGRALAVLARQPGQSVAQFALSCGLPRSSAFALVRHLEDGLLVERDPAGLLWPGSGAAALGFGAMGLAGLEDAADALAASLGEELDATVRLTAGETALVCRRAEWDRKGTAAAGPALEAPVGNRAQLRLTLRATASETQKTEAQACLDRTAEALSEHLRRRRDEAADR